MLLEEGVGCHGFCGPDEVEEHDAGSELEDELYEGLELWISIIMSNTYRRPGKAHHMPFFLELTELETDFYDSRKNLLSPFLVEEVPLLLHQDQDTVVV